MTISFHHHARLTQYKNGFLKKTTQQCLFLQSQQSRYFHPSRRKLQDAFPNHYETLDIAPSATPADIKKQFYALSKKYHPDVNHEPEASERFVKISEAYHVLGSADKKASYDRDYQRAHATAHTRHGSHHSSSVRSGPAGGRPASGLSKRRSQFRGPPPSFYAHGGYGTQGGARQRAQAQAEARQQQRSTADSNHPGGLGSQPEYEGTGGFSPGQDSGYYPDPDLPYFDREGHRRTHEGLGARREKMDNAGAPPVRDPYAQQGGLIGNFLIVSAMVAVATVAATALTTMIQGSGRPTRPKKKENG